jgi:hypothetical protein
MQKLFTCSILSVIVESLSNDLPLRYLIQLADSVGQYSISCSRKLGVSGIADIIKIVNYKLNLVFMGDRRSESLDLKSFHLVSFSVADTLYNCI